MKATITLCFKQIWTSLRIIPQSLYKLLHDFSGEYHELAVVQKWYVNGAFIFAIYLAWRIFDEKSANGFWYLAVIFWLCAVWIDGESICRKIYEATLGKLLLIALLSLVTNFAIGMAGQGVNDIVSVEPTKFPLTVALISTLLIPFFLSIFLSLGLFLGVLLGTLLFAFHTIDEKSRMILLPGYSPDTKIKKYQKLTIFVRFVSFLALCSFAYSWIQENGKTHKYDLFLKESATSFLYSFEMYSKLPCNLESGSKAVFLSSDTILVGRKQGHSISFNQSECKPVASSGE